MKEVRLSVPVEMWAVFKAKAQARNLTLTDWMTQAALAYERRAKIGELDWWPSGWRKDVRCIECNAAHDPMAEHPESFVDGKYSEYEREVGRVWK